jgi:glycerol-3-phosphate acyltransferase PlsY
MSWLLVAVTAWAVGSLPLALLIGRSVGLADELDAGADQPNVPQFVPAAWTVPTLGSR